MNIMNNETFTYYRIVFNDGSWNDFDIKYGSWVINHSILCKNIKAVFKVRLYSPTTYSFTGSLNRLL